MAIASLVLGIVSLVFACVSFSVILGWLSIVALVMGIVGIVLAGVAKSKGKSGSATAGLVLSILSTIFSFLFMFSKNCIKLVTLSYDNDELRRSYVRSKTS